MGRERSDKQGINVHAGPSGRDGSRQATRPPQAGTMSRLLSQMVEGLPLLDGKTFDRALSEIAERPRTSLHYLFEQLTSGEPAARAVASRLLVRCGDASVQDDLSAIVFDADQDPWTKVLANDLLAELGSPVDPDVFATSVENPGELQKKLPSRVLRFLAEGDAAAAAAHARTLDPVDRFLMIYEAGSREKEGATEFLRALAGDDQANAAAVVGAIGAERIETGVPLLLELRQATGHDLQKVIKRVLFDMRKAGVEIPEEKPRPTSRSSEEETDSRLPLHRALMSEPTPEGRVLVVLAWERQRGRLKVFTVVVDLWKRGIADAALRVDMSRSSFERFVSAQSGRPQPLKEMPFEECRRMIARGACVAKEFGSPLPYDFGVGKALLGVFEEAVAAVENPFLCSACGRALDAETVERIRASAPYDNIPVEARCAECR